MKARNGAVVQADVDFLDLKTFLRIVARKLFEGDLQTHLSVVKRLILWHEIVLLGFKKGGVSLLDACWTIHIC